MNCRCGAKWCQVRQVCSVALVSEQNGQHQAVGSGAVAGRMRTVDDDGWHGVGYNGGNPWTFGESRQGVLTRPVCAENPDVERVRRETERIRQLARDMFRSINEGDPF